MKRIGIVTFQETNNYGALLQNYALQKALEELGVEGETIDYKSDYIGKPYRLLQLKKKGFLTYCLGVVGYLIYLPRTKNNRRFRKLIRYSKTVHKDELKELQKDYDAFITGSDQVFNYSLTDFDPYYMLGFVEDKSKCMSYAASLGKKEIEADYAEEFEKRLRGFRGITLREPSAQTALASIGITNTTIAPDPCVLLNREAWDQIALSAPKKEYIFVYQLGVSKEVVAMAKALRKKYHLPIIYAPFPVGGMSAGTYHITAGAQEVITYIKYASYVVTDSFHGTLLSILYEKEFYTKAAGTHGAVGNRILDLLKEYGLENRLLTNTISEADAINYEKVSNLVEKNRAYGRQILQELVGETE